MPIAEVIAEGASGVLRFAGRVIVEWAWEGLVRGIGYAVLRIVAPRSEPTELRCDGVGCLVVLAVAVGLYLGWPEAAAPAVLR